MDVFAQYYTTTTVTTTNTINPIVWLLYLAVIIVVIAGLWKVFTKAGEEGWKSIIPIYSTYVLLKIVGRPGWWLLLFFVPFVNLVVLVVVLNDLSKSFGHAVGMTLVLFFFPYVGFPYLGFSESKYKGPAGPEGDSGSASSAPAPAS